MDRNILKEKLNGQISEFGDGKDEFETSEINELLNWIGELEAKVKEFSSKQDVGGSPFRVYPQCMNLDKCKEECLCYNS